MQFGFDPEQPIIFKWHPAVSRAAHVYMLNKITNECGIILDYAKTRDHAFGSTTYKSRKNRGFEADKTMVRDVPETDEDE